jgi:phage gp36-like protein
MTFTAYATQQNMIDAFTYTEVEVLSNLSDPGASAINTQVLAQALTEAAAEIDAYLGARYDLEAVHALATFPANLVRINCDIARYRLDNVDPRETVETRYKAAIKFLQDITKGIATLGLETPTEGESDTPVFTKVLPTFTKATLSDYASF